MIKKIFSSLLLIGIGFLGFSYAGLQEFDIGVPEEITSNTNLGSTLTLGSNANFYMNGNVGLKVVQFKGNGQYATTWTYFWNGTGMYVIESCVGGYNCNGSIQGQGYINFVNIVQYSNINMQYAVAQGFTPVNDFLTNSDYKNPDKLLLGGNGDMQESSLCFVYSDLDKAVCFGFNRAEWNNCSGHPQFCTNGQLSYITNSKGYTSQDLDYLSNYATRSPFVSNYTPPSFDDSEFEYIDKAHTYDYILYGCEKIGLNGNYCLGGFDSSVIFPDSGFPSLANYVWGQGVDIIDLYNMYSGSYNTPNKFMQAISKNYNMSNVDWFRGKPLALYMFATQYFPNKDDLQFSFMDIWDYCSMWRSIDSSDDYDRIYTGNNLQVCINEAQVVINNSQGGNGITIDGSGAMSVFGSGRFTDPEEFFGKIYSFFDKNLVYEGESFPGVLPNYISFFLLAIIFIRIISKGNE